VCECVRATVVAPTRNAIIPKRKKEKNGKINVCPLTAVCEKQQEQRSIDITRKKDGS